MKVVLVLPSSGFRRSSPTSATGAEHLGLGYIAAYLRQFGHEVIILNFQVEEAFSSTSLTTKYAAEKILSYNPDIVGMSITGMTISEALLIASQIKQTRPFLHICWGSHQASSCASEILKHEPCVDTITVGDGEIPWQKLLAALENGEPLSKVPGLWYRENGLVIFSGPPPEPDLNTLPFPSRDTLEELIQRNINISDARISTSRGCPFNCTFCVYPALGYQKRWRARTASSIVDEIKYLNKTYGISQFWFNDDNFVIPTKQGRLRVLDIAERLIKESIDITYRVLMRADAVNGQKELIETLVRSGLICVYIGIESGSPRRLGYFDKRTTPDIYRRAVELVREQRIGLQIGFIMFDPMTSWDDLEIDARFLSDIEEMYLFSNYSQVLDVYPGTPISKTLMDKGLLAKNFNYSSNYRAYSYENHKIGILADTINAAYSREWVEIDDFFRRLRMIDVPRLYRCETGSLVDDLSHEVETKIRDLNKKGTALFFYLLDLGREGADKSKILSSIRRHYHDSLKSKGEIISKLQLFPDKILKHLSALQHSKKENLPQDTVECDETRRI